MNPTENNIIYVATVCISVFFIVIAGGLSCFPM